MAILTILSDSSSNEGIKIIEDDVWKIDRYTTALRDSFEVRRKNDRLFQEFQRKYPQSGSGSISLLVPKRNEYKKWNVLYEKHLIAFRKILEDDDFLEYYDSLVQSGHFFQSSVAVYQMLKSIKPHQENRLYFEIMRDMIWNYLQYTKENPNAKSIDQLYEEAFKEGSIYPKFMLPKAPTFQERRNLSTKYHEVDPDIEIYDQQDRVDGRYSLLDGFLGNPHFERHYPNTFIDGYFFLLGTVMENPLQKEIYQNWYTYAENGFDGTVVCPLLSKNSNFLNKLDKASIAMFCIFEEDPEVEKLIALTLVNQAEVIIELYDITLYPKYSKKYPKAVIVLSGIQDEDTVLDTTDTFMIDCYNHANSKRYQK